MSESSGSPELREVLTRFWSSRRDQIGPIIEAARARGQIPAETSPAELMKYIAAPFYYQLLLTDEPLSPASGDRAASAALAAARAGILTAPGPVDTST